MEGRYEISDNGWATGKTYEKSYTARTSGLALEDVHDHGGFALRGPAFDGGFVAHLILLIAAL